MEEKIFDKAFRNELYKMLIEAGYDEPNALHIVSLKYHTALKTRVLTMLSDIEYMLSENRYEEVGDLAELAKQIETLKEAFKHVNPQANEAQN